MLFLFGIYAFLFLKKSVFWGDVLVRKLISENSPIYEDDQIHNWSSSNQLLQMNEH